MLETIKKNHVPFQNWNNFGGWKDKVLKYSTDWYKFAGNSCGINFLLIGYGHELLSKVNTKSTPTNQEMPPPPKRKKSSYSNRKNLTLVSCLVHLGFTLVWILYFLCTEKIMTSLSYHFFAWLFLIFYVTQIFFNYHFFLLVLEEPFIPFLWCCRLCQLFILFQLTYKKTKILNPCLLLIGMLSMLTPLEKIPSILPPQLWLYW